MNWRTPGGNPASMTRFLREGGLLGGSEDKLGILLVREEEREREVMLTVFPVANAGAHFQPT